MFSDHKLYYEATFLADNSSITIEESNLTVFDINRSEFRPSKSVLKKNRNLGKALVEGERRWKMKQGEKREGKEGGSRRKSETSKHRSPPVLQKIERKKEKEEMFVTPRSPPQRSKTQRGEALVVRRSQSPAQIHKTSKQSGKAKSPVVKEEEKKSPKIVPKEREDSIERCEVFKRVMEKPIEPLRFQPLKVQSKTSSFPSNTPQQDYFLKPKESSLKQKQKQKQQIKQLCLIKTLTRATNTSPFNFQDNYPLYLQFNLQTILCLLLQKVTSQERIDEAFRLLEEEFDIDKVEFREIANSRLCAVLAYLGKELRFKLKEGQLSWVERTLEGINRKMIGEMNNCKYYDDMQQPQIHEDDEDEEEEQEEENEESDQDSSDSLEPQDLQHSSSLSHINNPTPHYFSNPTPSLRKNTPATLQSRLSKQILSLLRPKIKQIEPYNLTILRNQILTFLQEQKTPSQKLHTWTLLSHLINSEESYEDFEDIFRKLSKYMMELIEIKND